MKQPRRKSDKVATGEVFAENMSNREFTSLCDMIKQEFDFMEIYNYIERFYSDRRSKWGVLERALKKVYEQSVDNR